MDYEYKDENIYLKLIDGNIYQVKDNKDVKLTEGCRIPYFTFITEVNDKLYFKYDEKLFYYDKIHNIIYFEPENNFIYKINGKDVSKEQFEIEFQKRVETYIPYSEYWPKKEDLRKNLQERREIWFPTYDKRYKDRLVIIDKDYFMACEEEILEIANLVEENEYDPEDNDSLRIAIALWNAGYRKGE